jgi:polynucleotide 5'-hydroxyl-kinase GRC3/NOL9
MIFSWEKIIKEILDKKGKVFLLGESDSGKTTFAKTLITKAIKNDILVGWVDADIGQSTIGPPTCIGLSLFSPESPEFKISALYFVGNTSPHGRFVPLIMGTKKLVDLACKESDLVVIDTTGAITGVFGQSLKYQKILTFKPDFLLAFQREKELEKIIDSIKNFDFLKIYLMEIPENIRIRTREERAKNRQEKFKLYFKNSKSYRLSKKNISFYPSFDFLPSKYPDNLIAGLKDSSGEFLALAIFIKQFDEEIEIITPLKNIEKIATIEFGDIRINQDGEQLEYIPSNY